MLGHPEGRSVAEEPRSGLTRRNALTLGTTSCGLSRVLFAIYARFHAAVNKRVHDWLTLLGYPPSPALS